MKCIIIEIMYMQAFLAFKYEAFSIDIGIDFGVEKNNSNSLGNYIFYLHFASSVP